MEAHIAQLVTLGPDCDLQGELSLDGDVRYHGRFQGVLRVRGELEVGPAAQIRGTIEAASARIAGHVEASINVTGAIELAPEAVLLGDIRCASLIAPPGSTFRGELHVGRSADSSLSVTPVDLPPATQVEPTATLPTTDPVPAEAEATPATDKATTTPAELTASQPVPTAVQPLVATVPDVLNTISLRRRTRVLGATGLRPARN
mgnify:CR=1 FL=1